jgi:hypothetical protein
MFCAGVINDVLWGRFLLHQSAAPASASEPRPCAYDDDVRSIAASLHRQPVLRTHGETTSWRTIDRLTSLRFD